MIYLKKVATIKAVKRLIFRRVSANCPIRGMYLLCLIDYFHKHEPENIQTPFESKQIIPLVGVLNNAR
jgi:hypothetical protein